MSITLENGNVYTGELLDGKPHGKGVMKYIDNGRTYEGGWSHGLRSGFGKLIYIDGCFNEGNCVNDCITGKCVCVTPQGEEVSMDCDIGCVNGYGYVAWVNG